MMMRYPISLALAGVLLLCGVATAGIPYNRYRNNYKPQPYPPPIKHDASDKALQDLAKDTTEASKAEVAFNRIGPKLRKEFEASPAWQSAQTDLKTAQAEYDAVRVPVLDALHQTPAYQAARAAKDAAEINRNAVTNDSTSTAEQRMAVASAVLNAGSVVTKMEGEALTTNAKVNAVHEKLVLANNKVQSLEKVHDASIRKNVEWLAARKALDDANAKVAAAKVTLQKAQAKEAEAEAARQDRIRQIDEQNRAHGYPTSNQ